MIVLFMVISFILGCVDWICQSFLSGCVAFLVFFSTIAFGLVVVNFWPFLACGRQVFLLR